MADGATIWKYNVLPISGLIQHYDIPGPGMILHFDKDQDVIERLAFWIEVNPYRPVEPVAVAIIGTGRPIPVQGVHVGTVVSGSYVWHLYRGWSDG